MISNWFNTQKTISYNKSNIDVYNNIANFVYSCESYISLILWMLWMLWMHWMYDASIYKLTWRHFRIRKIDIHRNRHIILVQAWQRIETMKTIFCTQYLQFEHSLWFNNEYWIIPVCYCVAEAITETCKINMGLRWIGPLSAFICCEENILMRRWKRKLPGKQMLHWSRKSEAQTPSRRKTYWNKKTKRWTCSFW